MKIERLPDGTYRRGSELVAVTLTDVGQVHKWHKGEIVTLKWEHAGVSGVGQFRVMDARGRLNSAIVDIDLEPVDP